jgi:DNA repair protein RadC
MRARPFRRSRSSEPWQCVPSHADIQMTQAIVEAARPFAIAVHDHIIVGKDGHASFKALKLL